MASLSELPVELVDRIFAFIREPGAPLKLEQLAELAQLRLVSRSFAVALPVSMLLSGLWLSPMQERGQGLRHHRLCERLRSEGLAKHVTSFVLHGQEVRYMDPSGRVRLLDPALDAFLAGLDELNTLSISSLSWPRTLDAFQHLRSLRRLAIHGEYARALPPALEACRTISSLVILPRIAYLQDHTYYSPIVDPTWNPNNERYLNVADVHLSHGNSRGMLDFLLDVPIQPRSLSISIKQPRSGSLPTDLAVVDLTDEHIEFLARLQTLTISGVQQPERVPPVESMLGKLTAAAPTDVMVSLLGASVDCCPSWVTLRSL